MWCAARVSRSVFLCAALLVGTTALCAGAQTYTPPSVSEYTLFKNLVTNNSTAYDVAVRMASENAADATGLVGDNSPDSPTTIYPRFVAENQRGAFSPMEAALLIANDAEVYKGWQALAVTYAHQNPDGSFGTQIAADGCTGSQCMRFFMAESGHVLAVLLDSPYVTSVIPDGSGLTYSQEITNLLPKIKLAIDYMLSLSTRNSSDSLYGDFGSPNRALSDDNAFGFAAYLLRDYAPAASSIASYQNEAQWWTNNIFVQSGSISYRALADQSTGVFWEGDGANGFGYDSSYGGVATTQAMRLGYYFPSYMTTANVSTTTFLKLAGRWVQQRVFYPTDPLGTDTTPFVDDTDNLRTGPTGYAEPGKAADFDIIQCQMAMFWYTALYNRPEGVQSVSATGTYALLVNRPPVIFNDPDTLTMQLTKGTAMPTFNAYATNTGIQNGGTQTLDPAFSMTVTGLPPGLSLAGPYVYPTSLHLDSNIAHYTLSGTPTTPGSYAAVLTPVNRNGTGAPVTLNITVGPVPTMSFNVANHTYGDAAFSLSASSNSIAPITYSAVSGPATVAGSTLTITGVGSVTVQAVQAANSDFAGATASDTFTIAPAVLQVGLSGSPSRFYGTSNSILVPSITGFVYGENSSVLSGAPTLYTSASPKSPAGSYVVTVTQGTLTAANYTFNTTNGTLTVMGGAAQSIFLEPITNIAINSTVAIAAQSTSGLPVTLTVASGPGAFSGNVLTATGHGAITITASQPGDGNFAAATPVSRTITVP